MMWGGSPAFFLEKRLRIDFKRVGQSLASAKTPPTKVNFPLALFNNPTCKCQLRNSVRMLIPSPDLDVRITISATFLAAILLPHVVVAQARVRDQDVWEWSVLAIFIVNIVAIVSSHVVIARSSSRLVQIARHFRSFVLPFVVVALIPSVIIWLTKINPQLNFRTAFPAGFLWVVGLSLMLWTIDLFANKGRGTLAPFDPPAKLVVTGPYLYTRNPMITGVLLLLIGLSVFYASIPVAVWSAVFFIAKSLYFVFDEEPTLSQRYAAEYDEYKKVVPRWVPNLSPYSNVRKIN